MKNFLLIIFGLLFMISVVFINTRCHALDYFVEGGLGATLFQKGQDGRWFQDGVAGSVWDAKAVAFRAGGGISINEHWSAGLNYLDLGTVSVQTKYVADESYDAKAHHCHQSCDQAKDLRTFDTLRGGELIGMYTPWAWPVAPYLRGGVAVFSHSLKWETERTWFDLHGMLISAAMGGGACYRLACADVTYYKGIGSTKFPVSQDAVVPMISIRLPF